MAAVCRIGIVGGGWRADFFARLTRLLPDRLELVGAVVRRPEAADELAARWDVPVTIGLGELPRRADLVITSLPWDVNPGVVVELVRAGTRVLSETPPAPDLDGLRALWAQVGTSEAVQVAEQYHLMPGHAARAALVRRGVIGTATQVQVSSTHTYHAVSLIRSLLDVGRVPARVSSTVLHGPLVDPLDRHGWTGDVEPKNAANTIATLDLAAGRSGVYDFTDNQWHNQLRHRRIVVRGERGEIADDDVVHAVDARTILHSPLIRQQYGHDLNLDGHDTELIAFAGQPVWRNPFLGHRLMDEEIAIAELIVRASAWATDDGPAPYPLADACHDHQLGLAIDESAASGRVVETSVEPWTVG